MKISKLFHWLYACVMLAPIIAGTSQMFYATFNKNAKDSYSDSYIEQLTQVNNSNLLIDNSDYFVSYNENNTTLGNQIYNVNKTSLTQYITLQEGQYIKTLIFLNDNGTPRLNYTLNDNTTLRIMNWQNVCPTFTFNIKNTTNTYFNTNFTSIYLITLQENKLDNAFYYGMDKMANSDLFKWASDSFLSQPITYVTGLFNMPNDSPFILLMSYWLNISIIWLTFDLIMYVPLLVHRWIDKGVLE